VRLIGSGTRSAQVRDVRAVILSNSVHSFRVVKTGDPRQHLGRLGEQLAAEHLQRLGYAIVARNHRTRHGEIDLIATFGGALVFVEVKTRRGRGDPWAALHDAKRAQVRRMARAYLSEATDRPRARLIRFDAIGVVLDARGRLTRLDHLEDAF
jgi:putative endonuclease